MADDCHVIGFRGAHREGRQWKVERTCEFKIESNVNLFLVESEKVTNQTRAMYPSGPPISLKEFTFFWTLLNHVYKTLVGHLFSLKEEASGKLVMKKVNQRK